jgi:hypothetical protein
LTLQTQFEAACKDSHTTAHTTCSSRVWRSHDGGGRIATSKKCQHAGSRWTYERHLERWTARCCRWLVLKAPIAGRFMCAVLSERRQVHFWEFQQGRRWRTRVGDQKNIDFNAPGNTHKMWFRLLALHRCCFVNSSL